MVQITYPIPYVMRATFQGRKQNLEVADEIIRDIKEAAAEEVPVVLSCKVVEPGSGAMEPSKYKDVVVRFQEGKFYTQAPRRLKDARRHDLASTATRRYPHPWTSRHWRDLGDDGRARFHKGKRPKRTGFLRGRTTAQISKWRATSRG